MALDEELTLKSVETAAKLPTPDVLFSRPPYTLMLSFSQTRITIQASHSGSLQLIKSYFELHASTNPNDVRNVSDACLEYAESVSVHMLFNLLVLSFLGSILLSAHHITSVEPVGEILQATDPSISHYVN